MEHIKNSIYTRKV